MLLDYQNTFTIQKESLKRINAPSLYFACLQNSHFTVVFLSVKLWHGGKKKAINCYIEKLLKKYIYNMLPSKMLKEGEIISIVPLKQIFWMSAWTL